MCVCVCVRAQIALYVWVGYEFEMLFWYFACCYHLKPYSLLSTRFRSPCSRRGQEGDLLVKVPCVPINA